MTGRWLWSPSSSCQRSFNRGVVVDGVSTKDSLRPQQTACALFLLLVGWCFLSNPFLSSTCVCVTSDFSPSDINCFERQSLCGTVTYSRQRLAWSPPTHSCLGQRSTDRAPTWSGKSRRGNYLQSQWGSNPSSVLQVSTSPTRVLVPRVSVRLHLESTLMLASSTWRQMSTASYVPPRKW